MRHSLPVVCALALLQQGCLAYAIAGAGAETRHVDASDLINVTPLEPEARLSCAGAPCVGAPVEAPYRQGRSRGVFAGVLALELGVNVASGLGLVSSAQGNGNSAVALWAVGLVSGLMIVGDVVSGLNAGDFDRHPEPKQFAKRVTAAYGGSSFEIGIRDVVPFGTDSPPSCFSVASAAARAGVAQQAGRLAGTRLALIQRGGSELSEAEHGYFAGLARGALQKAAPQAEVVAGPRIIAPLLDGSVAPRTGEQLSVYGSGVGASAVLDVEIRKPSDKTEVAFRVFEVKGGCLVAAATAAGATLAELESNAARAFNDMLAPAPPK
jgi:hypothetical protein